MLTMTIFIRILSQETRSHTKWLYIRSGEVDHICICICTHVHKHTHTHAYKRVVV